MIVRIIVDVLRIPIELVYRVMNGLPWIVVGYLLAKNSSEGDSLINLILKAAL